MHRYWLLAATVALAACERGGLRDLSDADLALRWAECRDVRAPTPILVQTCDNVERECMRRARELGNHVC